MPNELDASPSQVAINYSLCKCAVPIPGARALKQAEENLCAVGWILSDDMEEELDRAALGVGEPAIQNTFQIR
jgi:pyridoxine 4-dehydrogenase